MIDLKVNKSKCKEDEGIVYLLEYDLDDRKVVKVGITKRKIEERVCELVTSCFKWYRYFCRIYPKRFRKTDRIYEKEQKILDYLSEYKYEPVKPIQGHTEMLQIPLDKAVNVYEKVLKDKELDHNSELCPVCKREQKFNNNTTCAHECKGELGVESPEEFL